MSTSTLTRRATLAALGAMTLAAVAASHGALARRSTLPPPAIRVDVAPLAANAGEPTAGWVAQYLPGQIAQNLARRGLSASVSVRVDYLTMGSNVGVGLTGLSYDAIEGVATIDGVDTPVRATSTYYAMPADQTMIEQSNRDRVSQLTGALAYWIAQDAAGIAGARPRG
jgi:hypothetical protein